MSVWQARRGLRRELPGGCLAQGAGMAQTKATAQQSWQESGRKHSTDGHRQILY